MALNVFGPLTKDDIKVSYIDPILGLVEGVSIAEANEYDKKQPGTTFIFSLLLKRRMHFCFFLVMKS